MKIPVNKLFLFIVLSLLILTINGDTSANDESKSNKTSNGIITHIISAIVGVGCTSCIHWIKSRNNVYETTSVKLVQDMATYQSQLTNRENVIYIRCQELQCKIDELEQDIATQQQKIIEQFETISRLNLVIEKLKGELHDR